MASCERCWWAAHSRSTWDIDPSAAYHAELADAQERGDVCTRQTVEGAKARAGEYWDEATQRDRRLANTPNEALRAAIHEVRKAIQCLYLEVSTPVADDVRARVEALIAALPVETPSATVPVSREMVVMADSLLSWAQSGKLFDAQQDRDAGRVIAALRGTYDSQKARRFVGAKIDELAQILADRFARNGNANISAQDKITAQRFVFSLLEGSGNG